jgi:hypothetical protein
MWYSGATELHYGARIPNTLDVRLLLQSTWSPSATELHCSARIPNTRGVRFLLPSRYQVDN